MTTDRSNRIMKPHNPARGAQTTVKVIFFILAGISILGAASWSTYSLYELMVANSAQWAAVMACFVLDVAWVASLAMLIADVYGGDWRAEAWSWGTLVASAVTSALHGVQVHSWTQGVLGVLFTLASKGLTATYLHTLHPMLSDEDRKAFQEVDYARRMAEIKRRKDAELAHDSFRWNEAEPRFSLVDNRVQTVPSRPELPVRLERVEAEPEFDLPEWVNSPAVPMVPVRPELELAKVPVPPVPQPQVPAEPAVQVPEPQVVQAQAPVEPVEAEVQVPEVPAPAVAVQGVPTERKERVQHLAREIGARGGQLNSVPLSEVIGTYGLKPTAKATASNLRKDAHAHWLSIAPGTGNFM